MRLLTKRVLLRSCICIVAVLGSRAAAASPEPSGPHPRLWLDTATRASLKTLAKQEGNSVARAIRQCARVGTSLHEEARNRYMGLDWAAHASNCALAYQATGDPAHARTALHFFTALLDDWETVGDGKGGDAAARHDSGYAIRALGVHAAIVYDLLHDAPGMTPALLARARTRFAAWTSWYYGNGYRFKDPGTNYHAGYAFAVTLIAIAQGSEAGPEGARLWRHVSEQVWGREMQRAAAPGGLLEGGDWGEGWQYAPLAVAGYALAARAMIEQGVPLPDYERWAESVVLRHVHALLPSESGSFVGGDTQSETPSMPPSAWTLAGAIAGPSSLTAAGWARAELDRLHLAGSDKSFLVFEALADARGVKAAPYARDTAPTYYLTKGNGTMFARSSWSPRASWMAAQCTKKIEVDHLPANAGNFVLTRGADELVVDPSPYGSLSSLTSNAPSVESAHLPADYKPSQAYWSEKTGYAWARQTEPRRSWSRVATTPTSTGSSNDRATCRWRCAMWCSCRARAGMQPPWSSTVRTREARSALCIFGSAPGRGCRSTPEARREGRAAASSLVITPLFKSSGTPEVRKVEKGDCFQKNTTRGGCSAARFPVQDYVLTVKGEEATAIHVHRHGRGGREPAATAADDRGRPSRGELRAREAPCGGRHRSAGRQAESDLPRVAGGSRRARRAGSAHERARRGHRVEGGALCVVTITPAASGGIDARPLVITLSETCAVKADATQVHAVPASIDGALPMQLASTVETKGGGATPGPLRRVAQRPSPGALRAAAGREPARARGAGHPRGSRWVRLQGRWPPDDGPAP